MDGGPLAPVCPAGDTCPPPFEGYAGDIEVVADIENTLAVAKDSHVIVYNAPNDETGQTELDEYTAIANQDTADTVSSSWGMCENDVTAGYVQAENTIFEQMAFQGQSMFGSSGDTGAFGCIRSDGTTIVNAERPVVPAVGDQRRRHLAGKRQPGHQPEPRAAGHGHRDRLERPQPVQ